MQLIFNLNVGLCISLFSFHRVGFSPVFLPVEVISFFHSGICSGTYAPRLCVCCRLDQNTLYVVFWVTDTNANEVSTKDRALWHVARDLLRVDTEKLINVLWLWLLIQLWLHFLSSDPILISPSHPQGHQVKHLSNATLKSRCIGSISLPWRAAWMTGIAADMWWARCLPIWGTEKKNKCVND